MAKSKKFELIGRSIKDFDEIIKKDPTNPERGKVKGKRARLIPAQKKIDELFLASVFLASLPLVKEFRDLFSKEINLSRAGTLHAYTEVSFPGLEIYIENNERKGDFRVDGLLLQVVGGVIRDATIFEMKIGSSEVNEKQISVYMDIAQRMNIPRLVSISNQFVPSPKCYPINVQQVKDVDLYHFSWRNILVMGSILLTDNDLNISDPDQVNIMLEVMDFFRHPYAGITTFDSMGKGWIDTIEGIRAESLHKDSTCITSAVHDWLQEEQDLALKLSDILGLMVDCNKKQYGSLQDRVEAERLFLFKNKYLESQFKIKNAVSPIMVQADLGKRMIRCIVEVVVNQDRKTSAARLNWIKKQIEGCRIKKDTEKEFSKLEQMLWLDPIVKGRRINFKEPYSKFDKLYDDIKNCEIKSVRISLEVDFGGKFSQSRKFIEEYESLVISFYRAIVQNLKNWEESAPKMNSEKIAEKIEINQSEVISSFADNAQR
ncbi:MAG: hypothetical protein PHR69_02480 [Sphaerochaeta sp.]|nr:hypothetical protein [Sphaerochaeta sp.]